MKDRIRQLMEAQHMPQKTFANFIGISEATLSGIFNDRTRPSLQTVEAIKKKIPAINTDWLVFGKGPMYDEGDGTASGDVVQGSAEQLLDFGSVPSSPLPTARPTSGLQQPMQPGMVARPMHYEAVAKEVAPRKIAHITVYYDDQTWETFVPKK